MNKQHKQVEQQCNKCGKTFWVEYFSDGTYMYLDDPCECESGFSPVPGSPSIGEWLEMIKGT